jgi:hypothetical protein
MGVHGMSIDLLLMKAYHQLFNPTSSTEEHLWFLISGSNLTAGKCQAAKPWTSSFAPHPSRPRVALKTMGTHSSLVQEKISLKKSNEAAHRKTMHSEVQGVQTSPSWMVLKAADLQPDTNRRAWTQQDAPGKFHKHF